MKQYQVKLLGKVKFMKNNEAMALPYKKMEGLLAYLLVEGNTSRTRLSELFWEAQDINNAKKNLRNTVYNIKKIFGDDFIVTNGRSFIDINRNMISFCDYDSVNKIDYQSYLKNYAEFMETFLIYDSYSFEKWQETIRKQLHEKYISISTKEINILIENNNYDDALELVIHQLNNNQYDEEPYRIAMKIYQRQRRYNEALALYQKLADILDKDFSIRPEVSTRELFEKILLIRSSDQFSKDINVSLIGTHQQLSTIKEMISDMIKFKTSSGVLITGEAGVGKGNLIDVILKDELVSNLINCRVKCSSIEKDFSLNIIYLIFKYLDVQLKTENVLSIFADFFEQDQLSSIDKSSFFNYYYVPIQDVIVNKLIEISSNDPLIITIEDVYWIDIISLEMLKKVYTNPQSNIFIIFSNRENNSKHRLEHLIYTFDESLSRIVIKPWTLANISEYLLSQKLPISDQKVNEIYNLTSGNQLLVKGLVNTIKNNELIIDDSNNQIIEQGLLNINDKERKLLNLLSIFNTSVSFIDLINIYSESDLELIDILDNLCNVGLLEIVKVEGQYKYSFRHNLLKKYVYESINSEKRKQYHYIIASYYESKISNHYTIQLVLNISYHYSHSNNLFKALKYKATYLSLITSSTLEIFPAVECSLCVSNITYDKKKLVRDVAQLEKDIAIYNEDIIMAVEVQEARMHILFIKCRVNITSFIQKGIKKDLAELVTLAKKLDDRVSLQRAYRLMIFLATNNNDLILYKDALSNLIALEVNKSSAILIRFSGYYEYLNKNLGEAIIKFEESINESHSLPKEIADNNKMACYTYLGGIFLESKNYRRALMNLDNAYKIHQENPIHNSGITLINGYMMMTYYYLEDFNKAKKYAKIACESMECTEIIWKKALFYSYIYLLFNCDEKYRQLALKFLKKHTPKAEHEVIMYNLTN